MKIKKKVIFGMIAGLFAVVTVFNMGMLDENGTGDVSLDAIMVMAEAQIEHDPCPGNEWEWSCSWNGLICTNMKGCVMQCYGC